VLHAAADAGTAAVFLPDEAAAQPDAVAEMLQFAWQHTDVVRLRVVRPARQQQLTFLPT
jgi:hypothetical protein